MRQTIGGNQTVIPFYVVVEVVASKTVVANQTASK